MTHQPRSQAKKLASRHQNIRCGDGEGQDELDEELEEALEEEAEEHQGDTLGGGEGGAGRRRFSENEIESLTLVTTMNMYADLICNATLA